MKGSDRLNFRLKWIAKGYQQALLSTILLLVGATAQAQITPDGTLGGEQSQVVPRALVGASIEGGAIRGSNLFHSFSEFNIGNQQSVYFANPTGIQNILTRVTGNTTSNINGTLGIDGAANLFLLNPNGIIFGQNARLDVRGSFVGSTANAIEFGTQGEFSATKPQSIPLLTVNPSSLLYTQLKGGLIENQGQLRVPNGQSLLLVGGDVRFKRSIAQASGGRIELVGLVSPGSIDLNFQDQAVQLKVPQNGMQADVFLDDQAIVTVVGNTNGNIAIHAKNVIISANSRVLAGLSSGSTAGQAGDITINAKDTVRIDGGSTIQNFIDSGQTGKGGSIYIATDSLAIDNGASLSAITSGNGDTGNIKINARDSISLNNGAQILNIVDLGASGQSGDVNLSTKVLNLYNGAVLGTITRGEGDAGNVTILTRDQISVSNGAVASQVGRSGIGQGGSIQISTNILEINDLSNQQPSQISAGSFGKGDAGNVTIEARDRIAIKGMPIDSNGQSVRRGVFTSIEENAVGQGGNIHIFTNSLELIGSRLETTVLGTGKAGNIIVEAQGQSSFAQRSIVSSGLLAQAKGQGGDITISVGSLKLLGESIISAATDGLGDAGKIVIDARNALLLENSAISNQVRRNGVGQGKEVVISADTLKVMNGSQVTAGVFGRGKAGDIEINARQISIQRSGQAFGQMINSGIFSSTSGKGSAGNIRISGRDQIFIDNAIITSAVGMIAIGQGGNIQISADHVLMNNATITSAVEMGAIGQGGNIQISANALEMVNQSQLISATRGQGNAGDVGIDVRDRIIIRDGAVQQNVIASGIFSTTEQSAIGKGGNIKISTDIFEMSNLAVLSSTTYSAGQAGKIEIEARKGMTLLGSALLSGALGQGNTGSIFLNAGNYLKLKFSDIASVTNGGSVGGSIFLVAQTLDLDSASVSVNGNSSGKAGSIDIQGQNIRLRNSARIEAETANADGGNIDLRANTLVLRQGSVISTTAGKAQANGNGGNISINADVIVAPAKENSDISANAFRGRGGNITITTQGLFGISPAIAPTDFSDITASSQLGIQGLVTIAQPEVQPTQGVLELPTEVLDVSNQMGQVCPRNSNVAKMGKFVVSGTGSLPPNPIEPLTGSTAIPLATIDGSPTTTIATVSTPNDPSIVEAQGWIRENGKVKLVAAAIPNSPSTPAVCPTPQPN